MTKVDWMHSPGQHGKVTRRTFHCVVQVLADGVRVGWGAGESVVRYHEMVLQEAGL